MNLPQTRRVRRFHSYRSLACLLLGAALATVLLTSCTSKAPVTHVQHSPTATATSQATATTGDTNSNNGAPSKYNVGDTITVQGVSCTVTSVATLKGDSFVSPDAGDILIVVHVKIVNGSSSQFTAAYLDYYAASGGNQNSAEAGAPASYTANNLLTFTNIAPGGNVEGDIIFQVVQGDHTAMLLWQPAAFGSTSYSWNLGL